MRTHQALNERTSALCGLHWKKRRNENEVPALYIRSICPNLFLVVAKCSLHYEHEKKKGDVENLEKKRLDKG